MFFPSKLQNVIGKKIFSIFHTEILNRLINMDSEKFALKNWCSLRKKKKIQL